MAEPMRYPERIEWAGIGGREGEPIGPDESFEHARLYALDDSFEAHLGSFCTTGDAVGFDEAKRCAEAAFRALIDLNNTLSQPAQADVLAPLSPRERDVVEGLRRGVRLSPLAREMGVSVHTVRNFLKGVYRKLGVHSQVELLAKLSSQGGC